MSAPPRFLDVDVGDQDLRVASLACRVFRVPTDQPEADGTLAWDATTVVVVTVTAGRHTGLGWTYCSAACKALVDHELSDVVLGQEALNIPGLHERMVRACRNIGRPGLASCAISAVDVALWDLKGRALGLPLHSLFGACRQEVPLYGSGGFTTYDDRTATEQLEYWTGPLGMRRVKIKIGESWGTRVLRDIQRVALARSVIGSDVELFVDANGAYSRKAAVRIGRRLTDDYGVSWLEEPVSSDDLAGLREVRNLVGADVAAGEYGYDPTYFARMLGSESVDCLQIDVTRCGGYTAWLRIAGMAHAHGFEVSGHCCPSLHLPVALAVPNLRHVEYFHDHARLEPLLFCDIPSPRGGVVQAGPAPGHGFALREPDATRWELP